MNGINERHWQTAGARSARKAHPVNNIQVLKALKLPKSLHSYLEPLVYIGSNKSRREL